VKREKRGRKPKSWLRSEMKKEQGRQTLDESEESGPTQMG